ncbi:hypothetical protein [Branchiibius hedensis]|uniref:hypothetical protein n=1 Tax=Branchiibius hedensis TaxID=672460 RepID=UPI0011B28B91|nr:hypothetical protein [Branchiibius hedensis]
MNAKVRPTTGRLDGPRWHASCSTCGWQTTGHDVATVARIGAIHVDQVCTDASLTVQPVAYVGAGRRG